MPEVPSAQRHERALSGVTTSAVNMCMMGAMDPALSGVLGAAIGATAGLAGTFMSNVGTRKQAKRKERADSYATALTHLTRAAARRSDLTATGQTLLAKGDLPQWFLDLADAEHSLAVATGHSSPDVRQEMVAALRDLTTIVQEISKGPVQISPKGETVMDRLWSVQERVARCVVHDLGAS